MVTGVTVSKPCERCVEICQPSLYKVTIVELNGWFYIGNYQKAVPQKKPKGISSGLSLYIKFSVY
jgi:hypothetical protein